MSWNVAGLAETDLDDFLTNSSLLIHWDIMCLQEAFVRAEGIESAQSHGIYTSKQVTVGLRSPAIIVRDSMHKLTSFLTSGRRWVACKIQDFTVLSVHLPHQRRPNSELNDTRLEMSEFLLTVPRNAGLMFGIDATSSS